MRLGISKSFTADIEFTSDIIFAADPQSYLSSLGIPQIGTTVRPGMVLIGRLGQKKSPRRSQLCSFELQIMSEAAIREHYRQTIQDRSIYAPNWCHGVVVSACVTGEGASQKAIVEVDLVVAHSPENESL